jgi:hypothetical protein
MNDRFLSTQFQHELLLSYHFILSINQPMWSWCIVERQTHTVVAGNRGIYHSFSDIETELNQWQLSAFGQASILFFSENNVLVPISFYDETKKKMLYQFCNDLSQGAFVETNTILATEMMNLFLIPEELHSLKNRILPQAVQYHVSTSSILASHQFSLQSFHPVILIGIYQDAISLTIADGGKVLFSNYFRSITQEDMLYWIVCLIEQLELDGSKIALYVNGNKPLVNERMAYLSSFFSNVFPLPFPSILSITKDAPEDYFQPFIDSFYLLLCE